jgi:hypothetical protein
MSEFMVGSISRYILASLAMGDFSHTPCSLSEFESDGSAHGDSPPSDALFGKEDCSSNGSDNEVNIYLA